MPPKGHRLRRGRFSEPGRIYLVTFVTRSRIPIFRDLYLGRIVVNVMKGEQCAAETLCYVIMPDHVHWLMELGDTKPLSTVVQTVKSISAHRIRQTGKITGNVWQRGFHDHAVRKEEDIRTLARYVVANPVRAGLVERIGDYSLWDAVWLT